MWTYYRMVSRLEAHPFDGSNVVHPPSCRYEDEINRHSYAENEFVTLKKVS